MDCEVCARPQHALENQHQREPEHDPLLSQGHRYIRKGEYMDSVGYGDGSGDDGG